MQFIWDIAMNASDQRGRWRRSFTLNSIKRKHGPYYVYVLLCDDGSYYTGYSNNPSSRLLAHMNGHGARYTRMHKPSKIIYLEKHRTRRAAMRREGEIKALTHEEKRIISKATTKTLNPDPK